jgi:hypothetical protein
MGEWMHRSHFLDLGTSWRWVVSFTTRPLYSRGKAPTQWIGGWVDPRAGLDDIEKRKFLTLMGLELLTLSRLARSQSLYRLHYPGSLELVILQINIITVICVITEFPKVVWLWEFLATDPEVPGSYSRPYQIFWEVGGLERGPLSLVRTTEELLEWKSSGSGLENWDQRAWEFVALITQHPLPAKVGIIFADKRRSLGRYSSFTDYDHRH